MPGETVPTAAHGELGACVPRQVDHARDVGCVGHADDRRGPAVEPGEEDTARAAVSGVIRSDHPAVQLGAEVGNRDIGVPAIAHAHCTASFD
jgi:hypothetical protein